MHKKRLEAFNDGVLAIILTIMGLGLSVAVALMWVVPGRRIESRLS